MDFGSNIALDPPGEPDMLMFPFSSLNFDTRFMETGDNELVRISKETVDFSFLLYTDSSFHKKKILSIGKPK
jgi:hypothetical protein